MRIVVYPHDLGLGGSQLNAIELAAGVRDRGHEVVVFGQPGALVARIEQLGLDFAEAPRPGKRPSPSVAAALTRIIDARGIDLVHGYEWPPTLEAEFAASRRPRVALTSTVMSMSVPAFIPRRAELVVGTEEIAAYERARGRARVSVIEPPVDLSHNRRDLVDAVAFRQQYRIDDDELLVVSVARFAQELKLEGTLAAIDVVSDLARDRRVRLVLVGDGPARDVVEARIRSAEARSGRSAVTVTGQLDDPRPAYAAADITLGMGGSALRALAFGSPLIVQGERGFWSTLEPATLDRFLWTGWYGVGDGESTGAEILSGQLIPLLDDAGRRRELGDFGLSTVRSRFSLEAATDRQLSVYERAIAELPPRWARARSDASALARYSRYYGAKRIRRLLGRESTDDFNAAPVTARNKDAGAAR